MVNNFSENTIRYNPARNDYSLSQEEFDQIWSLSENDWKNNTIAVVGIGIPCIVNSACSYKDINSPNFIINALIGFPLLVLGFFFAIQWYKNTDKQKKLKASLENKPKMVVSFSGDYSALNSKNQLVLNESGQKVENKV